MRGSPVPTAKEPLPAVFGGTYMKNSIHIVLVGVGGYGNLYVNTLLDDTSGRYTFSMVDPYPGTCNRLEEALSRGIRLYGSLSEFYAENEADLAAYRFCVQLVGGEREELTEYALRAAAGNAITVFRNALLTVGALFEDRVKIAARVACEILEEAHFSKRDTHIFIHGNGKFSFEFRI